MTTKNKIQLLENRKKEVIKQLNLLGEGLMGFLRGDNERKENSAINKSTNYSVEQNGEGKWNVKHRNGEVIGTITAPDKNAGIKQQNGGRLWYSPVNNKEIYDSFHGPSIEDILIHLSNKAERKYEFNVKENEYWKKINYAPAK